MHAHGVGGISMVWSPSWPIYTDRLFSWCGGFGKCYVPFTGISLLHGILCFIFLFQILSASRVLVGVSKRITNHYCPNHYCPSDLLESFILTMNVSCIKNWTQRYASPLSVLGHMSMEEKSWFLDCDVSKCSATWAYMRLLTSPAAHRKRYEAATPRPSNRMWLQLQLARTLAAARPVSTALPFSILTTKVVVWNLNSEL